MKNWMQKLNWTHQYRLIELALISLLILLTSYKAFQFHAASLVAVGHMLFLFTAFLFLRPIFERLNPYAGRLYFALTLAVYIVEFAIQSFSNLHLNMFIVSLLVQPGASEHIGAPLWLLIPSVIGLTVAAFAATQLLGKYRYTLNVFAVAMTLMVSLATSQFLHGYLFFTGQYEVASTRSNLPFFVKPSHYYMFRIMGLFLDDVRWAPLTETDPEKKANRTPKPEPVFANKKNLLLIISDSLRSIELRDKPELVPNILRWSQKGWINYDHYSVSNCTFGSMYAMFTGRLPTSYTASRAAGYEHSLFDTFLANDYNISIDEASPLDWYGLAQITIPDGVKRTIMSHEDFIQNDSAVTDHSIETIAAMKASGQPFFHTAYYYGNHYPYIENEDNKSPSYNDYLKSVALNDKEIGRLLDTLETRGLLEDTIIVLTSDHGEEFTENGHPMGHSTFLTDAQTIVPFIVIGEGNTPKPNLKSHMDFRRYITSMFQYGSGKEIAPADEPLILADCGHTYPDFFAVISKDGRIDFSYDDGYLSPIVNGTTDARQQHQQFIALNQLLAAIKRNEEK